MSYDCSNATCVCVYTHCKASVVHFFVIWIIVLLLVLWRITRNTITSSLHLVKRLDCIGFSDLSGISTTRLVVGVISAVVEKDLGGERNFGFDSLKSRLNCDMEEKGIVARDCCPGCLLSRAPLPGIVSRCPGLSPAYTVMSYSSMCACVHYDAIVRMRRINSLVSSQTKETMAVCPFSPMNIIH